jgi:hypothetical protein
MGKNKDFEIKRNFYNCHLNRQAGSRGRKLCRLSLAEDLINLGRKLGIRTTIER